MTDEKWMIINTSALSRGEPISALFAYICKGLAKSYRLENVSEVANYVSSGGGETVFIDYAQENYGITLEHWKWNSNHAGRMIGYGFKFKKDEALTKIMLEQPWITE